MVVRTVGMNLFYKVKHGRVLGDGAYSNFKTFASSMLTLFRYCHCV
jgi:hypothetical protein